MKLDTFVEDDERVPLVLAFRRLAMKLSKGNQREALLTNANVDASFRSFLDVHAVAASFADGLVAACLDFSVSDARPNYHPLLQILTYLTAPGQAYQLHDQERSLFKIIMQRGQTLFQALAVRGAVGRIESPSGHPIGTGVLVSQDLLLTCLHIFKDMEQEPLRVRFGYTQEHERGTPYELDPALISSHSRPDHALIKIKGRPPQRPILPKKKVFDREQVIYLMHYPQTEPQVISDAGRILEVGMDFIDHTVPTAYGSSGAPIFNEHWQFVALHRGDPGTGRCVTAGTTEGIPLAAFWDILAHHVPGVQ